jgi:hypothetical protein
VVSDNTHNLRPTFGHRAIEVKNPERFIVSNNQFRHTVTVEISSGDVLHTKLSEHTRPTRRKGSVHSVYQEAIRAVLLGADRDRSRVVTHRHNRERGRCSSGEAYVLGPPIKEAPEAIIYDQRPLLTCNDDLWQTVAVQIYCGGRREYALGALRWVRQIWYLPRPAGIQVAVLTPDIHFPIIVCTEYLQVPIAV